ncbi:MAG: glycosyltransferase family 2 protein [Candidatus Omnitrophica bacterium]|nr:glycosyltransferase family 2 protein [Candidatus Omnitrophota bacterium]
MTNLKGEVLVSIAMTTYNGEKFLREQLESIYEQTYKNIEIVVCDDGSSDGTISILQEYEKKYGLRLYVNETNLGYVKNFEKACSLCKGEYIALSDQDDVWLPHKLATLKKVMGPNLLVFSDMRLIDEEGDILKKSFFKCYKMAPERALDVKYMAFRNYVTGCTVLFKQELLRKALPFNVNVSHDYWLAMISLNEGKLTYSREQLTSYRQHSSNIVGIKAVSLLSTIKRTKIMMTDFNYRKNVLQGLASYEYFNNELKVAIKCAFSAYEGLTNPSKSLLIKALIFVKYHKYIFSKNLLEGVLLRIRK